MAVLARRPLHAEARLTPATPVWHLAWFVGVCVIAFLIPFTLTSVLDLQHDLYYLVYFAITLVALTAYVRAAHVDVINYFRARWQWSLAVGGVATAFVVWNVLAVRTQRLIPTVSISLSRSSGAA
jgi:hypothetical protein